MSLVWINGTLTDKAAARVSPFDHGLLYGDGAWEHFRVFRGELFRPAGAVAHLFTALRDLSIDIGLSPADLVAAITATVRANNRTEGYVRVVVTRGPGTLGPDPRKLDPQVIIIAEEYHPFPAELYDHGLHVVTAPVRVDVASPAVRVRSLGRPHLVLAKRYAAREGCLDAVLVSSLETLAGCTEGLVALVHRGKVTTHVAWPPDAVGDVVLDLARAAGLSVRSTGPRLDALRVADEAFLAGTTCGVIGVVRLDGGDIGPGTEGPVTRTVREAYRKLTRGE